MWKNWQNIIQINGCSDTIDSLFYLNGDLISKSDYVLTIIGGVISEPSVSESRDRYENINCFLVCSNLNYFYYGSVKNVNFNSYK